MQGSLRVDKSSHVLQKCIKCWTQDSIIQGLQMICSRSETGQDFSFTQPGVSAYSILDNDQRGQRP